ncbi:hypothetical protein T01_171 [Trichinella spiralis]|uniref:Uncharacterized protein n=1 Tax=Trichinella spiralis TaxID=6334 RepID=A0A0V1BCQ3_TRISP|nr:hypothetical protein T01_171 [Trichinella spiralis]
MASFLFDCKKRNPSVCDFKDSKAELIKFLTSPLHVSQITAWFHRYAPDVGFSPNDLESTDRLFLILLVLVDIIFGLNLSAIENAVENGFSLFPGHHKTMAMRTLTACLADSTLRQLGYENGLKFHEIMYPKKNVSIGILSHFIKFHIYTTFRAPVIKKGLEEKELMQNEIESLKLENDELSKELCIVENGKEEFYKNYTKLINERKEAVECRKKTLRSLAGIVLVANTGCDKQHKEVVNRCDAVVNEFKKDVEKENLELELEKLETRLRELNIQYRDYESVQTAEEILSLRQAEEMQLRTHLSEIQEEINILEEKLLKVESQTDGMEACQIVLFELEQEEILCNELENKLNDIKDKVAALQDEIYNYVCASDELQLKCSRLEELENQESKRFDETKLQIAQNEQLKKRIEILQSKQEACGKIRERIKSMRLKYDNLLQERAENEAAYQLRMMEMNQTWSAYNRKFHEDMQAVSYCMKEILKLSERNSEIVEKTNEMLNMLAAHYKPIEELAQLRNKYIKQTKTSVKND